jgi:hypothetical protein
MTAVTSQKVLANIKECTGASDEDVKAMLQYCNGDVNATVQHLLDNPFSKVTSKKDKKKAREDEKRQDPPQRQSFGYAGRGGRGGRGEGRGGGYGGRGGGSFSGRGAGRGGYTKPADGAGAVSDTGSGLVLPGA